MPAGPSAAFFDLDRTLISGSSAFVLGVAAWRAGLVPPGQFGKDAVGAIAFRFSGASDDTSNGVRDRILGAVKGIRVDDLVALNADIVPKLLAKVRPEAQALVDRHRHAGRATYIVSASPVELVEPLAKALGMTAGIGTVSAIADGVYTGELAGPFCYGPGKVEAITDLARWENLDLAQCYAYSDSASDLPMLEAVGHPVAVNPDAKLERVRAPQRLADRRVQQAHEGGRATHHAGPRHRRSRRSRLRRRHPLRQVPRAHVPAIARGSSTKSLAASVDTATYPWRRENTDSNPSNAHRLLTQPPFAILRKDPVVSNYFLTTPIYYVTAKPHLGHAYTTIVGDALARWHRLLGDNVHFLTGTDEHGQKVQQAAEAAGLSPQEFTDSIAPLYQQAWQQLNISNDDFIRTTEQRHKIGVAELLQRCYDAGDIELDLYKGKYCIACEEYYTDDELDPGDLCRIHKRPVEQVEEENYFFRLSRFQDRLLDWYAAHPGAIVPEFRGNEALGLIRGGLRDFSVSRTSFTWGIPLPWDAKHVAYVWFDALANYLTAVGYGTDDERSSTTGGRHIT